MNLSGMTPSGEVADNLPSLAFLVGWSVAEKQHLPALPEIMARGLGVASACIRITRLDDSPAFEAQFPEGHTGGCMRLAESQPHAAQVVRPLGEQFKLTLGIDRGSEELTPGQQELFSQLAEMIHGALTILYVEQHRRTTLSAPFSTFSDREWYVAEALDSPESEKVIAAKTGSSPHTIHCHVKSVYKKLLVQSRLEVMFKLNEARARFRRSSIVQAFRGSLGKAAAEVECEAEPMRASA